jgi:hypothetical protein
VPDTRVSKQLNSGNLPNHRHDVIPKNTDGTQWVVAGGGNIRQGTHNATGNITGVDSGVGSFTTTGDIIGVNPVLNIPNVQPYQVINYIIKVQ